MTSFGKFVIKVTFRVDVPAFRMHAVDEQRTRFQHHVHRVATVDISAHSNDRLAVMRDSQFLRRLRCREADFRLDDRRVTERDGCLLAVLTQE